MTVESREEFDPARDRAERRTKLLAGFGWIGVVPLAILACLRILAHDASPELIGFNAFSQWLYLPAWAVLLGAARLRLRALTALAAAVVVAHLNWLDLPSLIATTQPTHTPRGARFRIMSANLFGLNTDRTSILAEIRAARPDVLLVQELTHDWARAFEQADLHSLLPQHLEVARRDMFGIGAYTRLPARLELFELEGLPAIHASVEIGKRTVHVYNVHTLPPVNRPATARWNAMFVQLAERIRNQRGAVLLAGDLNATPHTRWYLQLLTLRLRGAHEDRGRGWATTWPNGRMLLPPIRLDHLLLSPELVVLDVREGIGRGSDHRPLISDLVLLP